MSELSKQALKVDNNTSFPNNSTGYITPAILRTYNDNVIDSLVVEETYQPFTQSVLQSLDALDAFTASLNVSFDSLNAFTASASNSINLLNATTQSVNASITQLNSFTASQASINGGYNTFTQSAALSIGKLNAATASLQSFTASANISITALNDSSASQQVSINALNAATSSYVTSAITASSLVTASISGDILTFTKGNGSTFDVTIPTGSGGGTTIPAGTVSSSAQILNYGIFATTGSNIFIGAQTISGSLDTNGGANFGNTDAQYNSVNIITSKTNFAGNVYNAFNIDTDGGGEWSAGLYASSYNSFGSEPAMGLYGGGIGNSGANNILESYGNLVRVNKNTEISGALSISASFSAPLQNGYAYVGNASGRVSQVATSSFSGGSTTIPAGTVSGSQQILNYGIFATTGSNTFNGNQNVIGGVKVIGDALSIQGNIEGSGSQYSIAQLVIDGDPANIYSAFQGVDSFNNGIFSLGINSYNPNDGGVPTFTIQGGGATGGGDNTILTANPNNTDLNFWKPDNKFHGNVSVSGSLNINSGSYNGQAINNITPVSSSKTPVQNIVTLSASEYAGITPIASTLYIVI